MRLFGILLIFANLLAGGAFVYLATQDWKGRQEINAVGLRHILLLQGLPLDGDPDIQIPGRIYNVTTDPLPAGVSTVEYRAADSKYYTLEDGGRTAKTVTDADYRRYAHTEIPFPVVMAGGESVTTVSPELLYRYFKANTSASTEAPVAGKVSLADTSPVANQVAEVKRVQGVIKAALAQAEPATKLVLLRGWVLYQAENYETRLQYLTADATALEAALDARFAAILNPPQGAGVAAPTLPELTPLDTKALRVELKDLQDRKVANDEIEKKQREINVKQKEYDARAKQYKDQVDQGTSQRTALTLDETERRMALAHLLVHLDQDATWQKRVIAIVGLRRYVKAITLQVQRFADMTSQVELGIPNDQAAFVRHETLLREQATQNGERARAVAEEKAKAAELRNGAEDAAKRRATQLKDLTDQLTKVKNEVDELLVRQSGIEQQLFEIQREVGLTLEDVYRLEILLVKIERQRFGLPPTLP